MSKLSHVVAILFGIFFVLGGLSDYPRDGAIIIAGAILISGGITANALERRDEDEEDELE